VRDCLVNAAEVEKWWNEHGGLTEARCAVLLKVYSYVARSSFEHDRPTFEAACRALENLRPGYRPERPVALAVASRFLGYRGAEALAANYRRARRSVGL
jgi:hypothetical protein